MKAILDLFLNLDGHLAEVVARYGTGTYALLFIVIFCETGLVVTPFLPGDSLLFAAGAFASNGSLDLAVLVPLLIIAAIVGDTVNYWIGRRAGLKVLLSGKLFGITVKKEHLERTNRFFDKYGGKTIVIARFMPIVRTFAPFVAGACSMNYQRFLAYNIGGGVLWVALFTVAGYLFGNIPAVQHNFTLIIIAIIVISFIPAVIELLRHNGKQSEEKGPKN